MHVNISQEPLYTEIYRKNARDQSEHPDQAQAFRLTVRPPQCGHTVGEKQVSGYQLLIADLTSRFVALSQLCFKRFLHQNQMGYH
jgi:hypothetical protein